MVAKASAVTLVLRENNEKDSGGGALPLENRLIIPQDASFIN